MQPGDHDDGTDPGARGEDPRSGGARGERAAGAPPGGGADNGSRRKERVIHTRVGEDLDEEIKRRAQRLGLSVSNLVRNVLQNTIDLVEDLVVEGTESLRAARRGLGGSDRPEVLGWQPAALAVNAVCERCNALLPRGTRAAIAVTDTPGSQRFRCERCAAEATRGAEPGEGGRDGAHGNDASPG